MGPGGCKKKVSLTMVCKQGKTGKIWFVHLLIPTHNSIKFFLCIIHNFKIVDDFS